MKDDKFKASEKKTSVTLNSKQAPTQKDDVEIGLSLKSESKASLGGESSSSTILSESDETAPVVSEGSQVSLKDQDDRNSVPLTQPVLVGPGVKSGVGKVIKGTSPLSQKKKVLSVTSSKRKGEASIPLKNSLPPLIVKPPPTEQPVSQAGQQDLVGERVDKKAATNDDSIHQTLGDSSVSDLVDVTDSEMSLMSGLNAEDTERQKNPVTGDRQNRENIVPRPTSHRENGEAGEGGEGDDSVSVTVTELSGEEEIEEDLDGTGEEDTMFEETPHQSGILTLYVHYTIPVFFS